ncbi:cytochrome P450 [Mycobacterium sp.]|uniref:cytochrome P450 n=1 Tax=Mycobacterium sp. TaxID=1785 RepID=UPI003D0A96D2
MTEQDYVKAPEKAVIDFDHHSEAFADGWREITADLRKRCPVAWTESNEGYWAVTGYEEVRAAALDDATFSSDNDLNSERGGGKGVALPQSPFRQIPIEVDPPMFNAYRSLLNPKFSPAAAEAWRPFLQQVTNALIDEVCETGELDVVDNIASPVPAMVTMRLLGLPLQNWERVATPFHQISQAACGSDLYNVAVEGLLKVLTELGEELAKRRDHPREDLLTFLATATIEPEGEKARSLTDEECIQICFLQLIGGVDTTTGLLSQTFGWLSDHPEEIEPLLNDAAYLKTATEEFLRWVSPAPALARTVTTETHLGDQTLRPGDRVLLCWASANQDETAFDGPEELKLDRWPNRHQAFGLGVHRCLGSNIARVVFQEVLTITLRRLPNFKVDLSRAQRYPSLGQVNGYNILPATFTPTSRLGSNLPKEGPPPSLKKRRT